ncbi:FliM/FliN family flagellar motor switch protein [Sphingomonas arenae]|uniref:FliM/FliN family flagellar motor switch protein n=1 Tax=Sphingomonas arenae TaxID=2812555 RepID=UPI0019676638|nr:FliM/FliN family flagellar motor C-terminal domain-containing protein [Sphingomonas arenae]
MTALAGVQVQLSVVLGSTQLTIRQVLKMGRGTMIPLDCGCDDPSELHVNGVAVARGRVQVKGDRMTFELGEMLSRNG